MKLLTTIVALMSVSSASAWGRSRGHDLAIPRGTPAPAKVVLHKEEPVEASLAARGGAAKAKEEDNSRLVTLGDIGNVLVIGLSVWLLIVTLRVGKATVACSYSADGKKCIFPEDLDPMLKSSFLDDCYICDGFCLSDPLSTTMNSHMLSWYIDLIMTVPLAWLWFKRRDVLEELGLAEYFVSSKKIFTVVGHGAAHWFLSKIMPQKQQVLTGTTAQTLVAGAALASYNITPDILDKLKKLIGIIATKEENEKHVDHLNNKVTHFLAPIGMAQTAVSEDTSDIIKYGVMIGTMYILIMAGVPTISNYVRIFALAASGLITWAISAFVMDLTDTPMDGMGLTFVVVFTAMYVISAASQLLFWNAEEKKSQAKPYAVSAWGSALFTTLVGWALALRCTALKDYTGHALYDFSIPLSYLIVYFWMKYF